MFLFHKQVPIVPYGGATSIEGHTLSPNGGVCIDMSLMKVCNGSCICQLIYFLTEKRKLLFLYGHWAA